MSFRTSLQAGILGAASVVAIVSATGAAAQDRTAVAAADRQQVRFDIPSQPLPQALAAYSRQSKVAVAAASSLTNGRTSSNVSGVMTADEALDRLLAGTGLRADRSGGSVILVADRAAVEADIPEILVRGSRLLNTDIRRTEDDTQPYVVFGADELAKSGASTVEDFLRQRLPMNTQIGSYQQVGSGSVGGQINLRGLGTDQTLILVDGRRLPQVSLNSGFGQPVLDSIPVNSIARIEILPSTASGIYGGGATGGVINIILKRDYSGFEVAATVGSSTRGDSEMYRIDLSGGFTVAGTRIMLNASQSDEKPLYTHQRDFALKSRELFLENQPLRLMPGAQGNFFSTTGANLVLDNGTALGANFGYVPNGYTGPASDNGAGLVLGEYDLNPGKYEELLYYAPRRRSAALSIARDFGDVVDAFVNLSGNWTDDETRKRGWTAYYLTASNPLNPFQQTVELYTPNLADTFTAKKERVLTGRGGLIFHLSKDWSAAFEHGRGKTRLYNESDGTVSVTAQGRNDLGANGLFSDNQLNYDPDALFFRSSSFGPSVLHQNDTSVRVAGPVFKLPGGPLAFTGMLEHRKERLEDLFGTTVYSASFIDTSWVPERTQSVDSVYAELRAPLFGGSGSVPGIRELELLASIRHDSYKTRSAGNYYPSDLDNLPTPDYATNKVKSTDFTLGLSYRPVNDLMLRASYGTGFIPARLNQLVGQTYVAQKSWYYYILDPRRGYESIEDADPTGTFSYQYGGNADLEPEKSKSLSLGAVFTPSFLEGFRLSVDYTNIKKTGEIIAPFFQNILDNEDSFPDRVVRGPNLPGDPSGYAGPIQSIDVSALNAATTKVRALDIQADYSFTTASGSNWRVYAVGTRNLEFTRQFLPTSGAYDSVGYNGGPLKWRFNAGVDYDGEYLSFGVNSQFYDSYKFAYADPSFSSVDLAGQNGRSAVPSQLYTDGYVGYRLDGLGWDIAEGAEVQLSVANIFDKSPPIIAGAGPSSFGYSTFGDPRLRRVQLTVRKRF